ncbi:hypothetical protein AUO95_05630 [Corynebacterium glutamicum]|nr:hypothetical protein AUO95_05630 [Corynebacterium glutamicum]
MLGQWCDPINLLGATESPGKGAQRLGVLDPREQVVDRPHGLSLVADYLAVYGVAERSHAIRSAPLHSALTLGCRLAGTLAFHLGPRHSGLDACIHAPTVGGEVRVTVGCDEGESAQLGGVDPVLQLSGLSGEPVEVVADDRVEPSEQVSATIRS